MSALSAYQHLHLTCDQAEAIDHLPVQPTPDTAFHEDTAPCVEHVAALVLQQSYRPRGTSAACLCCIYFPRQTIATHLYLRDKNSCSRCHTSLTEPHEELILVVDLDDQ